MLVHIGSDHVIGEIRRRTPEAANSCTKALSGRPNAGRDGRCRHPDNQNTFFLIEYMSTHVLEVAALEVYEDSIVVHFINGFCNGKTPRTLEERMNYFEP